MTEGLGAVTGWWPIREPIHSRQAQLLGRPPKVPGMRRPGFYAAEDAKALQAYLHAAALAGASLGDVLHWIRTT